MTNAIPSRPPFDPQTDYFGPLRDRGLMSDPTDPTSIPDPEQPVGEVLDVAPGALVRRPARRPSPQAGLAALRTAGPLLDRLGPGARDQMEREVRDLAAPSLVRMDAMEAVVEAATAWADATDTTIDDAGAALLAAVRAYREVSGG